MKKIALAFALMFLSSPAFADRQSADACSAGLSPDAKSIYDAAVGKVHRGGDNRAVVTEITESMVSSGQLSMFSAKKTAQAAGTCLKMLAN